MTPGVDLTLYLVTDRPLAGERSLIDIIERAALGGVTVVQLREKELSTRAFVEAAQQLRRLLDPRGLPLIINDRIDVALACGAAGVHVGQEDMPCATTRSLMGDEAVVGVSVSTPEEAQQAEREGADYLSVSPVFDTPTKTDTPTATGLLGLAAIREATRLPLVGIGGINATNASDVIRAGADGIAVVSAIVAAPDPARAALDLLAAIQKGRRGLATGRAG